MKLPRRAPTISELLSREPELLNTAFATQLPLDAEVGGKYRHWEDVAQRLPPPGLSHEAWWLRIKIARQSQRKHLPLLRDKAGNPFSIGLTDTKEVALS